VTPAAKTAKKAHATLDEALADIRQAFGDGSIMLMGENRSVDVEVIPTGIMSLDQALGVGGLPRGRIIELYGPESGGKSTLALHVVAAAQELGGTCAYIDAEHSLDPLYAKALGVDIDAMYLSQPDNGEQGLEILNRLVATGEVDVVVVDSVAALVPRAEIEGEMGDAHVGLHSRLMSQALRKLTGVIGKTGTVVIFINQIRMKIGVIYGSPETTPGGRALPFYASVRLDIRRIETQKNSDGEAVSNRTRVKVVKNKVAAPYKIAEFDLVFGFGVSKTGSVLDVAIETGVVQKSGAWITYEGEQLGQGRLKAIAHLDEHPDVVKEITARIAAVLHPEPEADAA
jgi:recombination protein RecA